MRAAISAATAGTWLGGFQSPSFSFQMWTSAFLDSGTSLSTSWCFENGPVRFPSSAMYQATSSSSAAIGGSGPVLLRRAGDGANPSINIGFGASIVRSDSSAVSATGGTAIAAAAAADAWGAADACDATDACDAPTVRGGDESDASPATDGLRARLAHRDDIAARLAFDLEDLPANPVVRD